MLTLEKPIGLQRREMLLAGHPPLYLAIYVDNIIYFLADTLVEQKFQEEFASPVKVDFMGEVDYYLGTHYLNCWHCNPNGHITCPLSQEGYYANMFVDGICFLRLSIFFQK
jgi:hypothetical protein